MSSPWEPETNQHQHGTIDKTSDFVYRENQMKKRNPDSLFYTPLQGEPPLQRASFIIQKKMLPPLYKDHFYQISLVFDFFGTPTCVPKSGQQRKQTAVWVWSFWGGLSRVGCPRPPPTSRRIPSIFEEHKMSPSHLLGPSHNRSS